MKSRWEELHLAECLVAAFREFRLDGFLVGSQQQVMCLSNNKNHSFGGMRRIAGDCYLDCVVEV
jgi:hypothetical protein